MNYGKVTSVIIDDLYPVVAEKLEPNINKFKGMIADFINKNHSTLFEIAPYDNIYYNQSDIDKMFASLDLDEKVVTNIMKKCFFWGKPYNPPAAKVPYVETIMCCLIYFLKNKKQKEAELTSIYLAFSGKFYASTFGQSFPSAPPSKYRSAMDYAVNNMINYKFDIKKEGNMFGAMKVLCNTWISTYEKTLISNPDDKQIGTVIEQLKGRIKSIIQNIAELYYDAYKNKLYLNYESDNLIDGEEFRITDNDANYAARITDNAVNYMVSNTVNMKICNGFSNDRNVRPLEIKDIIESIVSNKKNIPDLRRVINILICDFMRRNRGVKPSDITFMNYSLKEQPNTNDAYIKEMIDIIMNWLEENSADYRRRKNRQATVISYRKSIKYYICSVIHLVARRD